MGNCCVSSKRSSSASTLEKFESFDQKALTHESRAPPPFPFDEETVKEVLSEVPKPPSLPPPPPPFLAVKTPPFKVDDTSYKYEEKIKVFQDDEISEHTMSEVCSESVSTTTFNNDKSRDFDDEEEVMKQRVKRSPSPKMPPRNRVFTGESGHKDPNFIGRSPSRRADQSPGRLINNVGGGGGPVRLVQSREPGVSQVGRRGLRSDPNKRDAGECSGRRSRSPATNRSVAISRSPSARRTNRSPGRVKTDPNEIGRSSSKRVENGAEGRWPSTNDGIPNESLENPLVSLECFIFL